MDVKDDNMSKYYTLMALVTSGLLLTGCGGSGGASTVDIQTDRPGFLKNKVSRTTGFFPYGNILKTNPTFTWVGTSNATTYEIGHEDPNNTSATWTTHDASALAANCHTVGNTRCSFKPNYTFSIGDYRAWWVRAKVNGDWQDWSNPHTFSVIKDATPVGVPETISPIGVVNSTSPSFSWIGVTNATEYRLGYEEQETENSWKEHVLSSSDANCQSLTQGCTFTPPVNTFKNGDNIGWYVRANIVGNLGEWSSVKIFTVDLIPTATNIQINEVLATNTQTNLDPDFIEFSDWIELYNPSNQNVDISNYGLSDDDEPLQWKMPNGTIIKANGYLLVWADKKDTSDKALHTNFKLSSKGETLTLADSTGLVIDTIDFKKQESDVSAANQNGGIVFMSPTPGELNSVTHDSKDRSEKPDYSHSSGFYDNPIAVILTQINNANVFYTTDGSIPNQTSNKYTQAIAVNETMVIRAVALEVNGLSSDVVTNTYLISHNSTLPVVSLVVDPDHLFDPKIGIYIDGDGTNGVPNYRCDSASTEPKNYAQEWERPADLEYFGVNHVSQFILRAGLSISGECSRGNQKKGFSVELDKKFGYKSLNYKLYPSKDISEVNDFKLRPGSFGFQVSDVLAAAIVKSGDLKLDYQAYKTVQMYVNAEYWGLYHFREKKGKDFITSNYPNIDKDDLDIIKNGYIVRAGDINDYDALVDYIASKNTDLSNDADYQEVLTMIDEDNYIDYMSLMIYSSNVDWIDSNLRNWKEKKPGKKWRWMLDDLDSGFYSINVNQNWFTEVNNSSSPDAMIVLFKSLTKNTTFRQKFKARFTALLDTTLSTANMLSLINTIIDERKDYLPLEPVIWDSITSSWINDYVQSLKDFASQRNAIVSSQLDTFIP